MSRIVLIMVVLGVLLAAPHVAAHKLGSSHIFLNIDDGSIEGRFEVTVADINGAFGTAFKTDGTVNEADLAPRIDAIKEYLAAHTRFAPNGVATAFRITGHDLLNLNIAQYIVVEFALDELPARPEHLDINYSGFFDLLESHTGLLVIEDDWARGTLNNEAKALLVFSKGNTDQRLDLSGSSIGRGVLAMIQLGTHHIWIGIDHILFLVALLLPGVVRRTEHGWEAVTTFKPALFYLVKIVTVFTVAHTITLSAATLQAVELSPRIVESIIALSIAVAALDIIYPVFKQRIWLIVFGFGLFHGFGFASVLGELGIPPSYMWHSLLGFNVGVELGQIAIVCVIFPLLYMLRSGALYTRFMLPSGAVALIVVSLYWFIERGFEIDLPAGALLQTVVKLVA